MIFNGSRIGYHAYQIRKDGLWFVQYDFDNQTVLYEYRVREYVVLTSCSTA